MWLSAFCTYITLAQHHVGSKQMSYETTEMHIGTGEGKHRKYET